MLKKLFKNEPKVETVYKDRVVVKEVSIPGMDLVSVMKRQIRFLEKFQENYFRSISSEDAVLISEKIIRLTERLNKLEAPEVEAQELSNQICNGQKTLNQAREELGLEPLEECDKLFTTAQCCKKCED